MALKFHTEQREKKVKIFQRHNSNFSDVFDTEREVFLRPACVPVVGTTVLSTVSTRLRCKPVKQEKRMRFVGCMSKASHSERRFFRVSGIEPPSNTVASEITRMRGERFHLVLIKLRNKGRNVFKMVADDTGFVTGTGSNKSFRTIRNSACGQPAIGSFSPALF
jgi:hypothetical protein